jgi:exodeoxyribonuclease V alpha subunit
MVIGQISSVVEQFARFIDDGTPFDEDAPLVLPRGTLHVLGTYERLADGEPCQDALAGLVLTLLSVAAGNSCLDLAAVATFAVGRLPEGLEGRTAEEWARSLEGSILVGAPGEERTKPLILDGHTLYLQRFFEMEVAIASKLLEEKTASPEEDVLLRNQAVIEQHLDAMFTVPEDASADAAAAEAAHRSVSAQRAAARSIVTSKVSVIAGGPGTGKTTTIAKAIVAISLALGDSVPVIRLAAPTGKAAQRMRESLVGAVQHFDVDPSVRAFVEGLDAVTIHRLLGLHGAAVHRSNEEVLPAEIVICDETSMTALPLLAELIGALRPDARLVLVGDPAQLRSVEVGTVMDDLVGPVQPSEQKVRGSMCVTVLEGSHRTNDPALHELFDAVRRGATDVVLTQLAAGASSIRWEEIPEQATEAEITTQTAAALAEVIDAGRKIQAAARGGELDRASLEAVKVLAAKHRGVLGRQWWTKQVADALKITVGPIPKQVGLPVLITKNDASNGVFNGDVGVVVRSDEGPPKVWIVVGGLVRKLAIAAIGEWLPWWAMTIHKSQGSEFEHVIVSLPPERSRVVARELLYTGLTRAKHRVTIIATKASIEAAIDHPVHRASGLGRRLWGEEWTGN